MGNDGDTPKAEQAILDAVKLLDEGRAKAAAALTPIGDPQTKLDLTHGLAEYIRDDLNGWLNELRRHWVGEIWEAEEMSLAELARRVKVSKGRADQIVKALKKRPAETEHTTPEERPDV